MAFYPVRAPPLSFAKLDEDERTLVSIEGSSKARSIWRTESVRDFYQ